VVQQVMSIDAAADNRAGRDWQELLAQKGKEPIELQNASVEPNVNLAFDGSSVLIESGDNCLAIGPSEQAQINIIAEQLDRLPEKPQLIFTWTPIVSDTRAIDLTGRGTLDLIFENGGVAMGEVR
jgi:hypothetical protein